MPFYSELMTTKYKFLDIICMYTWYISCCQVCFKCNITLSENNDTAVFWTGFSQYFSPFMPLYVKNVILSISGTGDTKDTLFHIHDITNIL